MAANLNGTKYSGYIDEDKAKHMGITTEEMEKRLSSGDATLLSLVLATPLGAALYREYSSRGEVLDLHLSPVPCLELGQRPHFLGLAGDVRDVRESAYLPFVLFRSFLHRHKRIMRAFQRLIQ